MYLFILELVITNITQLESYFSSGANDNNEKIKETHRLLLSLIKTIQPLIQYDYTVSGIIFDVALSSNTYDTYSYNVLEIS